MTPTVGCDALAFDAGRTADNKVKATTATTMPKTQPIMKPTLVDRAWDENNMRIAAIIGIGLMAIPIARQNLSNCCAHVCCSLSCHALWAWISGCYQVIASADSSVPGEG